MLCFLSPFQNSALPFLLVYVCVRAHTTHKHTQRKNLHKMRIFWQNILKSKAVMGEIKRHTAVIQGFHIRLCPEESLPLLCAAIWIPYGGSQLFFEFLAYLPCVATLMLFRQLPFRAQTVNCSRLNSLFFFFSLTRVLSLGSKAVLTVLQLCHILF